MLEAEQSVLHPEKHRRLIADLASVCEVANVPPHMVKQSAKPFLSAKQLDWLVRFPQYAEAGRGLVVLGEQAIAPDTIMMAIAGALIRNYIDARVVSLNTLLKALEHDVELNPTVMLIPNLFVKTSGKGLPSWQVQSLYDALLHRRTGNRLTVAYVEDMERLGEAYGTLFEQHLEDHYVKA